MTDEHTGAALDELEALRTALDRVDAALLDGIRDRLALCVQVAQLKQRHGIDVLQPGRMQVVHRRARDYADRHGMSTDFVRDLYELLISEACRVEDRIVAGVATTDPSTTGSGDHPA
ncbi:MAG: chorismate mutase [Rhodococcus sp.]|uniref:chorismate mutase n=1 Tax=Rhodococcus TaxID=1827 RepID=UPI00169470BF|nr:MULTISPECIES: chorismate mutase [Rhodococcus]NLV78767.1 chorismate mutase [Rhodococcus sp. (in: high G+C Gram-positive bacteria)]